MTNADKNAMLQILSDTAGLIDKIAFHSVGDNKVLGSASITWEATAGTELAGSLSSSGNIDYTAASPQTIVYLGLFSSGIVTIVPGTTDLDDAVATVVPTPSTITLDTNDVLRVTKVRYTINS